MTLGAWLIAEARWKFFWCSTAPCGLAGVNAWARSRGQELLQKCISVACGFKATTLVEFNSCSTARSWCGQRAPKLRQPYER